MEPIIFKHSIEGKVKDLIIPKEFIRDFEIERAHLMIFIRVTGPDSEKVTEFFNNQEEKIFKVDTTPVKGDKISDEFILKAVYLDEGPPLSVDIDIEPPMVRAILDFMKK